jgi:ParB/RepB/Spo0J family partition protein
MTDQPATPYLTIALELIDEPSHRLRDKIDDEQLGQLTDSMAAEGLHQPIGLRGPLINGRFEIVWGHRRYLAAKLLRWTSIAARVFQPEYDPLLAAVSENLQRADLTPLEEAQALRQFANRGKSLAELGRLFRRSPTWVAQRINLLDYPPDLIHAIHHQRLPLSIAAVLRDIDSDDYRASLIEEAHRTGATAAIVEVWRAHYLADRDRIVANFYTVQQIAERREAWKITIPCDVCHMDAEYQNTTTFRVCLPCAGLLRKAIEQRDSEPADAPQG